MKKIILASAALAVSATFAIAQDKTIRMGTEGAYPPYNFINDSKRSRRVRARVGRRAVQTRRTDLRMGQERLGQHHPEPGVGQLRHHHGGHEHHRRA